MAASLSKAYKTTALNTLGQRQTRDNTASEMASSSKPQLQAPALLLVAALLFLVCATRVQGARPLPGSKDHMPQVPIHSGVHVFSLLFPAALRDSTPLLVILQCFAVLLLAARCRRDRSWRREEWFGARDGNASSRAWGDGGVRGRGRGGVSHEEDTGRSHRLHLHPGEAQLVASVQAHAEQ